jgi:DNA-binding transcriptional ArsR family regulator
MDQQLSDALAESLAIRIRVLGQPLRIKLVDRLRNGPAAVHELCEAVDGVQQNVSQHLALLYQAGVVSRRKVGTRVLYELSDPHVLELIDAAQASLNHQLRQFAQRINVADDR